MHLLSSSRGSSLLCNSLGLLLNKPVDKYSRALSSILNVSRGGKDDDPCDECAYTDLPTQFKGSCKKPLLGLRRHARSLAWSLSFKTKDGYERHANILWPFCTFCSMLLLHMTTMTLYIHIKTHVPRSRTVKRIGSRKSKLLEERPNRKSVF